MKPNHASSEINYHSSDSSVIENDTFWFEYLCDREASQPLSLLYDHQRISFRDHTDHDWSVTLNYDSCFLNECLNYATIINTSLENLFFTCYCVLLFKLTTGEKEWCIARAMHDSAEKYINM